MREIKGNLWEFPADARVVTTNGYVKLNGRAVMGRGVAFQAVQRYPGIDGVLGAHLNTGGNHVWILNADEPREPDFEYKNVVLSFPVKHNWWEPADPALIERSAHELVALANGYPEWQTIALPYPGCGNGGLDWADVKPTIEGILDDRFVALTLLS